MTNCPRRIKRASSRIYTDLSTQITSKDTAMNSTGTSPRVGSSLDHLRDWIGRSEERTDTITVAPLVGLAATLDRVVDGRPLPGSAIPPLAHWMYFLP